MGTRVQEVILQVEFIPLPVEREAGWRAGLSLLLQIMKGGDRSCAEEVADVFVECDRAGGDGLPGGEFYALLPVEADLKWE